MRKTILIGVMVVMLLTGCSNDTEEIVAIEPVVQDPVVQIVPEVKTPYFELPDSERWIAECIVMGEAQGESYDGMRLVAQCILNACIKDGIMPSEVRTQYGYAGWNDNPSEEVKRAVSAVFDDGDVVTDEPILYFYAPKWCNSQWHETQVHVLTEGGHKFFKEHNHDWW